MAEREKVEKRRSRNWCMVLYPEDPKHAEAVRLLEELNYRYVGILHDKDVYSSEDQEKNPDNVAGLPKKPHWHIVFKCKQARWDTAISKQLGITPNYLQECVDFDSAVLYLVHLANPDRYQYDSSEAFGNLTSHLEKLLLDDDEGMRVLEIVKEIDRHDKEVRYRDVLVFACNNGLYGEFRRLGCGVKYLIDDHNADIYQDRFREQQREAEKRRRTSGFGDFVVNSADDFAARSHHLGQLGFAPEELKE